MNWGVDLFAEGLTDKPNQKFLNLRDNRASSATKKAMSEVARWFNGRALIAIAGYLGGKLVDGAVDDFGVLASIELKGGKVLVGGKPIN